MSTYRIWYCSCNGTPMELDYEKTLETDGEPYCDCCGATPSSDPRQTLSVEEKEDWDD